MLNLDMTNLVNKRIVVTRARHQAAALESLIRQQGGIPIAYPCIEIAPPGDSAALDGHLTNLAEFDWLMLTSGNAARAIAERLTALDLQPGLCRIKVAVAGRGTGDALWDALAVEADFMPAVFGAESLANTLPLSAGERVFLPQSALADENAARTLRLRGGEVSAAVAYDTVCGRGGADVPTMLQRDEIDALTFASPSAAAFFAQRSQLERMPDLPTACIGQSTAARAADLGFRRALTARQPSLRGMVNALAAHFSSKKPSS